MYCKKLKLRIELFNLTCLLLFKQCYMLLKNKIYCVQQKYFRAVIAIPWNRGIFSQGYYSKSDTGPCLIVNDQLCPVTRLIRSPGHRYAGGGQSQHSRLQCEAVLCSHALSRSAPDLWRVLRQAHEGAPGGWLPFRSSPGLLWLINRKQDPHLKQDAALFDINQMRVLYQFSNAFTICLI